jgi:hypothetical protein
VKKLLEEAKRLLVDRGWCQGAMAKDEFGVECDEDAPEACHFCLAGALVRARTNLGEGSVQAAENAIADVLGLDKSYLYVNWNDRAGRTKEQVLSVMDLAIKKAGEA